MTLKNSAMVFAGLAIAVGTLTTKVMESNAATKEKVVATTQVWYALDSSSDLPQHQEIISNPISSAPTGPDCDFDNAGKPCGVLLSFPNDDAPNLDPNNTTTVKDLMNDYGTVPLSV